jgi:hypothetical protein
MRRTLPALLACALLAGCGGGGSDARSKTMTSTTTAATTVNATAQLEEGVRRAIAMNSELSNWALWHNVIPTWAARSTGGPALAALRSAAATRRNEHLQMLGISPQFHVISVILAPHRRSWFGRWKRREDRFCPDCSCCGSCCAGIGSCRKREGGLVLAANQLKSRGGGWFGRRVFALVRLVGRRFGIDARLGIVGWGAKLGKAVASESDVAEHVAAARQSASVWAQLVLVHDKYRRTLHLFPDEQRHLLQRRDARCASRNGATH